MPKLKALGGHLAPLRPSLGALPVMEKRTAAERTTFAPWRKLYKTARWRDLRIVILTRDRFTCQWPGCGLMTGDTSQLVVDHREQHRGDERLFWSPSNLQCLCKPCHDGRKQRLERAARHA